MPAFERNAAEEGEGDKNTEGLEKFNYKKREKAFSAS